MLAFFEKYKKQLLLLLALLICFFVYILFMNAEDFLQNEPADDKKVEVENMEFFGYKDGQLSWSIKAQYAHSAYTLDNAIVENISDGKLFDQDQVILQGLQAKKIRVNAVQERLYVSGGIKAELLRRLKNNVEPVDLWGEQMQYFSEEKKSFVSNVKIRTDDAEIESSTAQIDHQTNTVTFSSDFVFLKTGTQITGGALTAKLNEQDFLVQDKVVLKRKANPGDKDEFKRKDTEVNCNLLHLLLVSGNAEVSCQGNLKIKQEDKQGFAEQAKFSEVSDTLTLQDKAQLIFDRSDWLLDEATINKLKNRDIKSSLYEKLVLAGDRIDLSTKTKNFQAAGKVSVTLKDKAAVSDQAFYNQKEHKIYMTGNVKLKRTDGSWVQANQVIVDIEKETFQAEGQAESTVILKR